MAHDDRTRSPAERIAVEVFVYLMQRSRVRHYDIAIHCVTRRITHHAFSGPKHEIVRRYDLAPPFWPLTIERREAVRTGYGVNRHAVCIRYKQNAYSANSFHDGGVVARVEFGPGCQELMRRARINNPVFVCDNLAPRDAAQIVKLYLIDAAMSLAEGGGPLIVGER